MKIRCHFLTLLFIVAIHSNLIAQKSYPLERKIPIAKNYNKHLVKAEKYINAGNILKARKYYIKAIKNFEKSKNWKALASTTIKFLQTYTREEKFEKAIEITQTSIQNIEKKAPNQQLLNAQLFYELGSFFLFVENTKLALQAFQQQLYILKNHLSNSENWSFVEAYKGIGLASKSLGNSTAAIFNFNKAKNIAKRLNFENFQLSDFIFTHLYHYYSENVSDLTKAIEIMKEGLEVAIQHFGENSMESFKYCYAIGQQSWYIDQIIQSNKYLKKAIFILEENNSLRLLPENIYLTLAKNYMHLGDKQQALFFFDKSIKGFENNQQDISKKIFTIIGTSSLYMNNGEFDQAMRYISIADSLLKDYPVDISKEDYFFHSHRGVHWHSGKISEHKGNLAKAKKHYWKLINQLTFKDHIWDNIGIFNDLAGIHEKEGNLDSALIYNQKSLKAVCKTFHPNDHLMIPSAKDFKELPQSYTILNNRINLLKKIANQQKLDKEKFKYYNLALEIVDVLDKIHLGNLKNINVLGGLEEGSQLEISKKIYANGLSIVYDLYKLKPSMAILEKGFYFTQKMKAQQLWLTQMNDEAIAYSEIDSSFLEKEKSLLSAINKYEKMVILAEKNKDTKRVNWLKNKYLFKNQRAYEALLLTMEKENPKYYHSKYAFFPEERKNLEAIIQKDELLVEYVIQHQNIYIYSLSKTEGFELVKIPIQKDFLKNVDDLSRLLKNSLMNKRSTRNKFISISHQLYLQLLQPIKNQLEDKKRLVIIGDGVTNYIPFEVLVSNKRTGSFSNLDYLIKDFEISYHYSSSLFARARKKEMNDCRGVYAFAPVYDNNSTAPPHSKKQQNKIGVTRSENLNGKYPPLPNSENEVVSIIDLFNQQEDTTNNTLALRESASEELFKVQLEQPFKYIHIASHSFANEEHPNFSGIVCYSSNDTLKKEDDILHTGEIYNINIQADLVILSSCESGYGKLKNTEGFLGLNRAFIYSGASNVVFSLWKVYDKVNPTLMKNFYNNILSGDNYSTSLHKAKLNLLNNESTASPHIWAPYLLIGR